MASVGCSSSTSATDSSEKQEIMKKASELLAQGKRNVVCGEVPKAISLFDEAVQMLAKEYGDMSRNCVEAYFSYGSALLELGRMETNVLGVALEGVDVDAKEDEGESDQFEKPPAEDGDEREKLRSEVYDAMAEGEREKLMKETEDSDVKKDCADKGDTDIVEKMETEDKISNPSQDDASDSKESVGAGKVEHSTPNEGSKITADDNGRSDTKEPKHDGKSEDQESKSMSKEQEGSEKTQDMEINSAKEDNKEKSDSKEDVEMEQSEGKENIEQTSENKKKSDSKEDAEMEQSEGKENIEQTSENKKKSDSKEDVEMEQSEGKENIEQTSENKKKSDSKEDVEMEQSEGKENIEQTSENKKKSDSKEDAEMEQSEGKENIEQTSENKKKSDSKEDVEMEQSEGKENIEQTSENKKKSDSKEDVEMEQSEGKENIEQTSENKKKSDAKEDVELKQSGGKKNIEQKETGTTGDDEEKKRDSIVSEQEAPESSAKVLAEVNKGNSEDEGKPNCNEANKEPSVTKEKENAPSKKDVSPEDKDQECKNTNTSNADTDVEMAENKDDQEGEEEQGDEDGEDEEPEGEEEQGEGENQEGAESQDDGEEKDEDVPNFQLAWEYLELAKVIFLKSDSKEDQLKAAECHIKLGEVSMETEQHSTAAEDLESALKIQQKHLAPEDRVIAETHYQLGLAYGLGKEFELSIQHYQQAISVIEAKIASLNKLVEENEVDAENKENRETDDLQNYKDEIKELQELIPEMTNKIEDTKSEAKDMEKMKEMAKEMLGLSGTTKGFGSPTKKVEAGSGSTNVDENGEKKASDISSLVRKKRKPEEEVSAESSTEVKKIKQNDGAAVSTTSLPDKESAESKVNGSEEMKVNGVADVKTNGEATDAEMASASQ